MNEQTISQILNDVFSVHLQNANEIDYLEKYLFSNSSIVFSSFSDKCQLL